MPLVPTSRVKGNFGAAVVIARLAADCLVRPVAADTDIGVDLYCETVADSQPFLHFWFQVRTGAQCRVLARGNRASCRFSRDELMYWSRQPVPVFAALVPTHWPPTDEPDIYVVDLTTQALSRELPAGRASFRLRSDYYWQAEDRGAVQAFLAEAVPATTARLQVSKGIVASTPTPRPAYVLTTPAVPVLRFKARILDQLRTTAANSILFAILAPSPDRSSAEDREFRRRLARIVEEFDDDLHWENFMSRALSGHVDGNFEVAVDMYVKARACIQADEHVRDDRTWREHVGIINTLEAQARRREIPEELIGRGTQSATDT